MTFITPIAKNLFQLELIPYDSPDRTTGYLIKDKLNVLIETGASPSFGNISKGLNEASLSPDQIDAIVVTHIHLDHSGGVGHFLTHCPNAKVYVHERGAKFLIDPTSLIKGSREVYRDKFDQMFDPVIPVPEKNIRIVKDGESLNIGDDRRLVFFDAPGHALHHIFIQDTATNGIFTGDAAGAYYREIHQKTGHSICVPSAAPTQFDPVTTDQTISRMLSLKPENLFFTHYGVSENATACLTDLRNRIHFFGQECLTYYQEHRDLSRLKKLMIDRFSEEFKSLGVSDNDIDRRHLEFDSTLNALGIIAYARRIER